MVNLRSTTVLVAVGALSGCDAFHIGSGAARPAASQSAALCAPVLQPLALALRYLSSLPHGVHSLEPAAA